MRFRTYVEQGVAKLAALDGGVWRDLGEVRLVDILRKGIDTDTLADKAEIDIKTVTLLPPIPRPGKIICVGLNYVDHAAESPYKDPPKYPAFFPRFATSLIADGASIVRPVASSDLDFEGELAVIIGKECRHVKEEAALDYVAGYSIFNDASLRDYQFLGAQWTPGKNFDQTGAFGPEFVTADELPKGAHGLSIEVRLNGEVVQQGNTSDLIFPVAKLVTLASVFTTLEPGDVIATGTPAGVGFARKPPLYMKEGDFVEVKIDQIGTLSNSVVDEVVSASQTAAKSA